MSVVGFLLGHGPRGRSAAARTGALLQPAEMVQVIESPDATEEALEAIAADVPGNTVLRVVHLVEVDDDEVRQGLAGAAAAVGHVMEKYPAVQVKQLVVALVDREWDENERRTLLELDDDIAAVCVVSRSNEAAYQLRPLEEECMASDLAYALLASNLDESLGHERFWLVGTSAVYYRRRAIVAALVAHQVRGFLQNKLLAPLPATHTECDEGHQWMRDRNLGVGAHLSRLDRSAMGGSIVTEVRLDRDVFRRIRPELLIDSLRSFVTQRASRLGDAARTQIKRNRSEHLAAETEALTAAVHAVLERSLSLASAQRFLECARDELDNPSQNLQVALSTARDREEEIANELLAIDQELTRTIRRLPYRSAIAVRTAGLGALGVAGYHVLGAIMGLDPNFAVLGLAAGTALGTPLVMHYQRLRLRISSLRERYLAVAERRVQDQVLVAVLEAAASEVQELRSAAGTGARGLGGKLAAMHGVLTDLESRYDALVETRLPRALDATRLSVLVPTPDDMATDDLVRMFPISGRSDLVDLVMRCVFADNTFGVVDVDDLENGLLSAVAPLVEASVWSDLSTLLRDSDTTKQTVAALLATPTAPIVRASQLGLDQHGIRRMAARADELTSLVEITAIDGQFHTRDRDSLVQVAIRPVPTSMRGPGGDDVEA